jgi:hypothetical protein
MSQPRPNPGLSDVSVQGSSCFLINALTFAFRSSFPRR